MVCSIAALIIAYTISEVPYYGYSKYNGPQNPIPLIKAPILNLVCSAQVPGAKVSAQAATTVGSASTLSSPATFAKTPGRSWKNHFWVAFLRINLNPAQMHQTQKAEP